MTMISAGDYKIVYSGLCIDCDLDALSLKYGLNVDTLKAILHQKIVRDTMHNHHQNKKNAEKIKKQWENGETILEISKKINFPPVMTAWLILENKGTGRSHFRLMLRNPEKIPQTRLRNEITEALEKDMVYSPRAISQQVVRSKIVEDAARKWLTGKGIQYIDEKEAKERKHLKTPDFLLKKPITHGKHKLHWVECKASFGDEFETKRDYQKQLKHYVKLYGTGMVVYWDGFLDSVKLKDILIATRQVFLDGQ